VTRSFSATALRACGACKNERKKRYSRTYLLKNGNRIASKTVRRLVVDVPARVTCDVCVCELGCGEEAIAGGEGGREVRRGHLHVIEFQSMFGGHSFKQLLKQVASALDFGAGVSLDELGQVCAPQVE